MSKLFLMLLKFLQVVRDSHTFVSCFIMWVTIDDININSKEDEFTEYRKIISQFIGRKNVYNGKKLKQDSPDLVFVDNKSIHNVFNMLQQMVAPSRFQWNGPRLDDLTV